MSRRRALVLVVLTLGLLPVLATPSSANDLAREAASRAEDLVAAGEHAAASEILQETLARCPRLREGAEACRVRTYFGLGYVHGAWADADPKAEAGHRELAVDYHRRARTLRPDHRAIAESLVRALTAADSHQEAARTFMELVDRRNADDLARLADLELRANDVKAARALLFRAETLRPDDVEIHRRLLRTFRLDPGPVDEHREWCRRLWSEGLDTLAVSGLELLVERFATDPDAADWAIVPWAELQAARGDLDPADLARLPEAWSSPARSELTLLVGGPVERIADELRFWLRTPERASAATTVLRARARRFDLASDPDIAGAVLQTARRLAPGPGEETGGSVGRGDAWTDATVELAALYQRTGSQKELDHLVRELFEGKMAGYAGGDLASIARFHTVLGVILAEEGRYASRGIDNAQFQLRRALEVEHQLAEREGRSPRPLPHLEERYGEVLSRVGDRDAAAASYQRALVGYLALDDLASAEATAVRLRREGLLEPTVRAVLTIVVDRRRQEEGDLDPATVLEGRAAAWVLGDVELALPPETLERQRFRLLADLAASGRGADRSRAALLGLEARSAALEIGEAATVGDAERLRSLDASYRLDLYLAGAALERFDLERMERALGDGGVRYDG